MQPVTQILAFDHKPSPENPASLVDILEYAMGVSEAAQFYKTHWRGGKWSGGHDGRFITIRAGYVIDGRTFYPFNYSPL